MQSPSLKKLGKRPELHEVDGLDMPHTTPLSQSPGVNPAHQKRVLPSRSRRGGPGIGNSSVDMLIIDTEKRARDAKPVIPPTQPFFLTTQSRAVPPPPETAAPDGQAAGSYFDKPEVKAAYLAQRAIQVPEFAPLPDDAVGGRLRARAEEEGPETSDAAYLVRHRKYETFEKRQRRREKEKLIHEQYKLKERIEQLKGMDASAFGGGGEARRKEMLDIAEGLEMRYAVLLPPEPRRGPKKNDVKRRKSEGARAGTTTGDDADTEDEVAEGSGMEVVPPVLTGTRPPKANRQNVRLAPQTPVAVVSRTPAVSVAMPSSTPQHAYIVPAVSATPSSRTSARVRDGAGRFIPLTKSEAAQATASMHFSPEASSVAPETSSAPPPRKRPRVDSQSKRVQTPEATHNPIMTSVLLQIAARKAAQPQARQTSRTVLAFGFRVPPEVEDPMIYELPEWLVTQQELEHIHDMRARSATRSASPNPVGHVPNGVTIPKEITNLATVPEAPAALVNGAPAEPPVPALPTSTTRENNEKEATVLKSTN